MIEIITRIDCDKTEKALLAVSKIMNQSVESLFKEWTDINETLIKIAEASNNEKVRAQIILTEGVKTLDDLLGIL